MKTKKPKYLWGILVFCILVNCSQLGWANRKQTITVSEALDLAFRHNTSHSLFLWEQALAEQRDKLQKYPQVTAELKPLSVQAGALEKPEGSVSVAMPLGESVDLRGSISIKLDSEAFELKPTGNIVLNYDFFAPPTKKQAVLSAEEKMRNQANSLVLQIVDALIQLRQALDLKNYEEAYLEYLEQSLEAARLTPNFDDLILRRELREQVAKLSNMQEELDQLQLKLAVLVGTAEGDGFDPVLEPKHLELSLIEEDLREELFTANPAWREVQAEFSFAQEQLELERKTRGWDLEATGSLSTDLPWQIGLVASKLLYPNAIILEELELAVAKAKHGLEQTESALKEELLRALKAIDFQARTIEIRAEHLAEAGDDWDLRQRQFEAGLVTALQVKDTGLSLQKAELDYFHAQLDYVRSVLELWNLCGRDLTLLVFEIIA